MTPGCQTFVLQVGASESVRQRDAKHMRAVGHLVQSELTVTISTYCRVDTKYYNAGAARMRKSFMIS